MSDYHPFRVNADSSNCLTILDADDEIYCYVINTHTVTTPRDLEKADLICVLLNRYHEQQASDAPWDAPVEDKDYGKGFTDDTDDWINSEDDSRDAPGG